MRQKPPKDEGEDSDDETDDYKLAGFPDDIAFQIYAGYPAAPWGIGIIEVPKLS